LDWIGLDWIQIGLDWTGLDWIGLVVKRGGDHRLLDRHTSQSKQVIVVYKVNKRLLFTK
jgi:hypothetical protein